MSAPIQVGDVLFAVSTNRRKPDTKHLPVTKVGRKWIEVNGGSYPTFRADKETLHVDAGGYAPGWMLYRGEAEYQDRRLCSVLQLKIKAKFEWSAINTVTLEQCKQIAAILGIDTQLASPDDE